ncbi:START domain-containing protein [Zhouia amylolytica]|nr:START domain-containing protein [Zhouia amylolytica]SFS74841.1 START domain-containing protein [Zhouia amylolytica]
MKPFLIFTLILSCFLTQAQDWELKKNKNEIKIYTRKSDTSEIKEYKAVMKVNSSMQKALDVITDGNSVFEWTHNTSASKTLSVISENELIIWIKNDMPWPVQDRDHISRLCIEQNENTIYIDLLPGPSGEMPLDDNCIRITNFKGAWIIKKVDPTTIEVTQRMYGDPNGSIPLWLLNSMLATHPYHSFLNLKDILEN